MKILLQAPSFSAEQSKEQFFETVYDIPAYKSIKPMGSHFLLEVDNELENETIPKIFALFDDWNIDKSPLEALSQLVGMDFSQGSVKQ